MFCIIKGSLYNLDDIKKVMPTTIGYKDGHEKTVWRPMIVIQFKSGGHENIENMTFDEFIKIFTNEEMRLK